MSYVLGIAVFYPLFLLGGALGMGLPMHVVGIYWGVIQLALAYSVICMYGTTKQVKLSIVGILLVASGIFSFVPVSTFLAAATEALAITGLSLVLFDLGKVFPALSMQIPSGLIFLGVIFSILSSPIMNFVGLLSLLTGMLLSSIKVGKIRVKGSRE